jgi:hypothetical protein
MLLTELFHTSAILEQSGPPLTQGAQKVLADEILVAKVAEQLRDDLTVPANLARDFEKKSDEEVAEWFVRELDRFERQGYGGVIYGRNGQFHLWTAINYGEGRDVWEDVEGIMPEALRDFVILKNRKLLDIRHNDIQKFKGPRVLSRYMLQHYEGKLAGIRQDAELAGLVKNARSVKIVDNEDYRVYVLLNRGAACAFGKGARYCTANSKSDFNWKNYSSKGAIFGLVPKAAEDKQITIDGRPMQVKEKYQFDGPSRSFKEPSDLDMDPRVIKEKFPYLWTDIEKGIKEHQAEIENPRGEDDPDNLEILVYDVDKELQKLKSGLASYWTDKVRPKPQAAEPDADNQLPTTPPAA